jgi:hypothetical protein
MLGLGAVTQAWIPSYLRDRNSRITVKSYQDPISKNNLGMVAHACNPS